MFTGENNDKEMYSLYLTTNMLIYGILLFFMLQKNKEKTYRHIAELTKLWYNSIEIKHSRNFTPITYGDDSYDEIFHADQTLHRA